VHKTFKVTLIACARQLSITSSSSSNGMYVFKVICIQVVVLHLGIQDALGMMGLLVAGIDGCDLNWVVTGQGMSDLEGW